MSTYKKCDDSVFYISESSNQATLLDRSGNVVCLGLIDASNNFIGNLTKTANDYILVSDNTDFTGKIVQIDSTKTAGTIIITHGHLPENIKERTIIYKYNDTFLFKIIQKNILHCFIYGVYNYNKDAQNGGLSYLTQYGNLFIFDGNPDTNKTKDDYVSLISVPAQIYGDKILYTFCTAGNDLNLSPNTWNPLTFGECLNKYKLRHSGYTQFESSIYYNFSDDFHVIGLRYINNLGKPGNMELSSLLKNYNIYIYRNDLNEWYKVGYLSFIETDPQTKNQFAYFGGYDELL